MEAVVTMSTYERLGCVAAFRTFESHHAFAITGGPYTTASLPTTSYSMRTGILAGGNFIIDHVKLINAYPEQDMLADIRSEASSNGGGPYNVLKDLAALRVDYPLSAVGLVGKDANGDWILRDCQSAGIDIKQLRQTQEAPTSYTDAMTVIATGRRTFISAELMPVLARLILILVGRRPDCFILAT